MSQDNFTLIISIYSACLATALGILNFIKSNKVKLKVISYVNYPPNEIEIFICNISQRPATLFDISIGIGINSTEQVLLFVEKLNPALKILESEHFITKIRREDISNAVQERKIEQKYSQRLWVNVTLTSGKQFYNSVLINSEIIGNNAFDDFSEQYIATDKFVGFDQIKSIQTQKRGRF